MSSKAVLPPSRLRRSSPEATVHLLQKKLDVAEKETVGLVHKLAELGFTGSSRVKGGGGEKKGDSLIDSPEPIQPFIPRSAETEVLHKNYQTLVSRLCRNESQIQTLRLNFCSMQTAKDLAKKEAGTLKEQVDVLAETHHAEVGRLEAELGKAKKECNGLVVARKASEEEARRLQAALKDATFTKSDFSVGYEDIQIAKKKLAKRVNELREELGREVSLRGSLEESHATLLQRICDTESILENERREVQSLNENCIELRHEGARLLEEKNQERARRKAIEDALNMLKSELASKDGKIAELLEQNKVLASSLAASKKTSSDLHSEVEKQAKLVIDTQTLLVQVQSEREGLPQLSQKSSAIPAQEELSIVADLESRINLLEKQKQEYESRITQERQGKQNVQSSSSRLEEQLISVKLKLSEQETKHQNKVATLEHAVSLLKNELNEAQKEKEAMLKSKDSLMDEVNQAVDSMTEERRSVQEKIIQAQAEITNLSRHKEATEQDNTQLRERIAILEQHQSAHQKVESTITELLDSKNRLAYEKGQLQNRVEQLQRDMRSMENIHADASKLKNINSDLEAKLREAKRELTEAKQNLQHVENVLKQEQANAGRKEEDFRLAIQARDTALKDVGKVRGELEAIKLREKQKTTTLQKNLCEARSDHSKMAATLETIMTSHGQLQVVVETFQTEMGQRDHELAALRQERQSHKRSMEKMQREVTRLQEQLAAMETADSNQLASLNVDLTKAAQSQTKMATRLQEALATISKQQVAMEALQGQLDKRAAQYQILSDTRQHEKDESHQIKEELAGKIESLKQQLRTTRDSNHKKLTLELTELRQTHTDSKSRAEKFTKENKELLGKLEDLEQKHSKLKIRLASQKTQLDQSRNTQRANKDLESKLLQIQDQLKEMEQTKTEYATKNRDQSRTIASFMDQMSGLQRELESISEIQKEESDQSRDKVLKLERDAEKAIHIQKENAKLKKLLREMEEKKSAAEEKLAEASNESLQISNHLQEAHNWFQSRYSSLQKALSETKKKQALLEQTAAEQQRELSQERLKSEVQTKKAEDMIRASRQTLNQLANQAEVDQLETRTQMHNLAMRVQAERDHATYADQKMQKLLNTSAELVEDLALELDRSYNSMRP
nr:coiled-coil domain-containing protein 150-like [Lytechinus pictus]